MIDVVTVGAGGGSIAWLSPEGTLKVGPQSAGADPGPLCYGQGRHRASPSPTPTWCSAGSRRTCSAARSRSTSTRRRAGVERAGRRARAHPRGVRHRRPGDLRVEPGQRAAPGHRQARPRRPRLHAHHVRRLRLAAAVPADGHPRHPDRARAARPRQRVGVRAAHRRREERLRPDPRLAARAPRRRRRCARRTTRSPAQAAAALAKEGFADDAARVPADRRPALLRAGLRGAGAGARGAARPGRPRRPSPTRFHAEHRALYGYDFSGDAEPAGRVGQPAGLRHRPDPAAGDPARSARSRTARRARRRLEPASRRPVCFDADDGYVDTPVVWRSRPAAGHDRRAGRRSSRSSARRCRSTPASPPASTTTATSS